MMEGLGWAVNDLGNPVTMATTFPAAPAAAGGPADKFSRRPLVAGACKAVYDAARGAAGDFVLTLGGDHSVAVGSVAASVRAHPDVVVVWVDAHADFNIEGTSEYTYLHGFPLGYVCGEYDTRDAAHPFAWLAAEDRLRPSAVRLFAVRDVDPPERATLRALGVRTYSMMDVVRLGAGAAVEDLLASLPRGAPIHLSFDIDALDPSAAPATGTPVPGGLLLREGMYLASALAATGRLIAADMVEVNPRLAGDGGRDMTVYAAQWVRAGGRGGCGARAHEQRGHADYRVHAGAHPVVNRTTGDGDGARGELPFYPKDTERDTETVLMHRVLFSSKEYHDADAVIILW